MTSLKTIRSVAQTVSAKLPRLDTNKDKKLSASELGGLASARAFPDEAEFNVLGYAMQKAVVDGKASIPAIRRAIADGVKFAARNADEFGNVTQRGARANTVARALHLKASQVELRNSIPR